MSRHLPLKNRNRYKKAKFLCEYALSIWESIITEVHENEIKSSYIQLLLNTSQCNNSKLISEYAFIWSMHIIQSIE